MWLDIASLADLEGKTGSPDLSPMDIRSGCRFL